MFLGEYKHNLTKGNRLALPSKIRSEIEEKEIVLARGFEECILGYQKLTWEKISEAELTKPVSEEEARKIRRQLFSGAILIEIDQQGRMVIPKELLKFAKIKEKAIVVGAGDHFEIWDPSSWQNYKEKNYGSS